MLSWLSALVFLKLLLRLEKWLSGGSCVQAKGPEFRSSTHVNSPGLAMCVIQYYWGAGKDRGITGAWVREQDNWSPLPDPAHAQRCVYSHAACTPPTHALHTYSNVYTHTHQTEENKTSWVALNNHSSYGFVLGILFKILFEHRALASLPTSVYNFFLNQENTRNQIIPCRINSLSGTLLISERMRHDPIKESILILIYFLVAFMPP